LAVLYLCSLFYSILTLTVARISGDTLALSSFDPAGSVILHNGFSQHHNWHRAEIDKE